MESREGRQIVEEILRQMSGSDEHAISPPVLSAMTEVARGHSPDTVVDEVVVAELVGAALGASQPTTLSPGNFKQMCNWIAHSLCEDPSAAPRLTVFWHQLVALRGT